MQHSDLFDTLSASLEELESEILLLEEKPDDTARMRRIFSALGLDAQQWGGEPAKEVMDALKQGRIRPNQPTVDAFLGLVEALKRLFYMAAACDQEQCGAEFPDAVEQQTPAVPAQEQTQKPQDDAVQPQKAIPEQPAAKEPETAAAAPRQKEQAFIKVNTRKLDELMESVQELVISSTMMGQNLQRHATQTAIDGNASRVGELMEHDRCIESIRKHVLDIRKMNLRATCTRMSRLVREVAAGIGKQAELRTSGEELEVDKSILDDLSDPLIHLLRNAVDHGLETPQDRVAVDKPPMGVIRLEAEHEAGELLLRIKDDGRGLNRQRILDKAKERGLVPKETAITAIPDRELFGLIMQPGFSTAEKVSNVSGRGVGMDVVAQSLRAMQGELQISSQEGKGSCFTIRVPADKASLEGITQGVLVRVGDQHFVLRSGCVREVFRPTAGAVHTLASEGEVVATRHGSLPFYRTHCMLDITPEYEDPSSGLALFVESNKERLVLQVDDVLGERQVVVRTFAGMNAFLGESLFSGVAFIGSMTAMILDADRFLHNAQAGNHYLCCRFAVCGGEELQ